MDKIEILDGWSFPDTISVPDGWDRTQLPDLTRDNFNRLIEEHNKLVLIIQELTAYKRVTEVGNG